MANNKHHHYPIITGTLFIQKNKLTGFFPIEFCPTAGMDPLLSAFGLDCNSDGLDGLLCACCDGLDTLVPPCF